MTAATDKARENRLRRAAERQGFTLRKSRTQDPLALAYGWSVYRGSRKLAHFPGLDGIERWITDPGSRGEAS